MSLQPERPLTLREHGRHRTASPLGVSPKAAPNTFPGIGRRLVSPAATARAHPGVPETHPYPLTGAFKTTGSRLTTVPVSSSLCGRAASWRSVNGLPFFSLQRVFFPRGRRQATGRRAGGQSKRAGSGPLTQAGSEGSRIVSHDHGRPPAFAPSCPSSATSSPARAGVTVAVGAGRGRMPGPAILGAGSPLTHKVRRRPRGSSSLRSGGVSAPQPGQRSRMRMRTIQLCPAFRLELLYP